jgi:hypothetical protein
MIKRILVITALLSIAGTAIWLHYEPTYELPITIFGMAAVLQPISLLIFGAFALTVTLFVSMVMRMC